MYASNCPVSRPKIQNLRVDDDLGGGLAWNDQMGVFYPTDGEVLPFKKPDFMAYSPMFYGR